MTSIISLFPLTLELRAAYMLNIFLVTGISCTAITLLGAQQLGAQQFGTSQFSTFVYPLFQFS
jgi:hypothetical protein